MYDKRANGGTGRRARLKIVFCKKWEFDSLFAHQNFMNLNNFNSLIELFFYQSKKQDSKSIFLQWLNPNNKKKFTWEETKTNIFKLSKIIKENVKEGDRCLLVSENRPEWFISDLAIMLSGAITVPAYTTYTEDDYKYLIEDCEPTVVIVSNN